MHKRYDEINIPMELLRTLVTVSEIANVSRTAEALGLTQPAVTAQLKRLQSILKMPLFKKESYGRVVAPEAVETVKLARRILALNDQLLMRHRGSTRRESLSISISTLFGNVYFSTFLKNVHRVFPNIEVQLQSAAAYELYEAMSVQAVDLALAPVIQETPAGYTQLFGWEEEIGWIGRSDFVISPNATIPIVSVLKNVLQTKACAQIVKAGKSYSFPVVAQDWTCAIAAIKAGLGVSPAPIRFVVDGLKVLKNSSLPPLGVHRIGIFALNDVLDSRVRRMAKFLYEVVHGEEFASDAVSDEQADGVAELAD